MAEILGEIFGFYVFYAIFAGIFKHKVGLIIVATLSILGGIFTAVAQQSALMLISSLLGTTIVMLVEPIQIRKNAKKDDSTDTDKQDDE